MDTTAASGVLTLADNAVITTNNWNFGSAAGSSHSYEITGGANSGITSIESGGFVQINNYNASPVTISTSILDNSDSGLRVGGPGTTILTATSNYTGDTLVTSGVLELATNGSINTSSGNTTIGSQQGDQATLLISGGSVVNAGATLGDSFGAIGTATVTSGTWINNGDLTVGNYGTGVLNISGGFVGNSSGSLGSNTGSSGTANVSVGTWANSVLFVGKAGTGVLNITGGTVSDNIGVLGFNSTGSGVSTVSRGSWQNAINLTLGANESKKLSLGYFTV